MKQEDAPALTQLLCRDGGNLIYASPPFLDFVRAATSASVEVLLAERSGALVGAFPYAIIDGPDGCLVNSLPWWGSHGSVSLDRSAPAAGDVRRALLSAFVARMAELAPLSVTVVLLPEEEPFCKVYVQHIGPTTSEGRIGQLTDLPHPGADLDARLLETYAQKTRNLVRKGLKQGFVEDVSDDEAAWDFLHLTHVENMAALGGKAKPRVHFAHLRDCLPPSMRRLSLAMDAGAPVAALLTLSFNGTVEYFTPAIKVEHRSRQPLSFLIHRCMMDAVSRGYRRWNWGGTWRGQNGLHHFKAGFGAVDRPYSYIIAASEAGLKLFRERRGELSTLFPYFYVYPFRALDDPA